MPAPPARIELSGPYPIPSSGQARAGMGKLYDWLTGVLGSGGTGTPAEARAALGAQLEPGFVGYTAGSSPPPGWLKRNGAAVSRTTYAALFAAIGTTYGAGNGTTTFNVPDGRAEFDRGLDDGRGIDVGRALGTAQGDAIRNITGFTGIFYRAGAVGSSGALFASAYSANPAKGGVSGSDAGDSPGLNFDASLVVPTAAENRPRNVAYLPIIKY